MKPRLILLAALLSSSQTFAQGSLTPPPGPPVASMKTLDQIEPRIDLATVATDANNRFVISQPGCYYLSSNIAATGKNGIAIHVDNVSIDLGGFSLIGDGTANRQGIFSSVAVKNIRVSRGTIRGFAGSGITLNGSRDVRLDDLTISDNGVNGVHSGDETLVSRCIMRDNAAHGIWTETRSVISHCAVVDSGLVGIRVAQKSQVRNCVADSNGSMGINILAHGLVADTSVSGNGGAGIFGGNFLICRDCVSNDNGGHGFQLSSHVLVSSCVAAGNQQHGFQILGGVLTGCSATANYYDGISLATGIVKNCHCVGNGAGAGVTSGAGISTNAGCRIEGNVCSGNDIGIAAQGGLFISNLSHNNTGGGNPSANYHTGGSSTNLGPVVNASTATNPASNFSLP